MNTLDTLKTMARRAGALGLATIALSLALTGCAVPYTSKAYVGSPPQASVPSAAVRGTVEHAASAPLA